MEVSRYLSLEFMKSSADKVETPKQMLIWMDRFRFQL